MCKTKIIYFALVQIAALFQVQSSHKAIKMIDRLFTSLSLCVIVSEDRCAGVRAKPQQLHLISVIKLFFKYSVTLADLSLCTSWSTLGAIFHALAVFLLLPVFLISKTASCNSVWFVSSLSTQLYFLALPSFLLKPQHHFRTFPGPIFPVPIPSFPSSAFPFPHLSQ